MKKFIVTGADGFIGNNIIRALIDKGHFIYAVNRANQNMAESQHIKYVECSNSEIENLKFLIDDEIECFIHAAWQGSAGEDRQNFQLQNQNAVDTVNAYKIADLMKCKKFLSIGTISERVAETIACNKKIKTQNLFYGCAKHSARLTCEIFSRVSNTRLIWAQLANIYGKNNNTGNIISYTINMLSENKPALFSNAEQYYDLLYIEDCIRAIIMLAEGMPEKSLYFIGSGMPRILKKYLEQVGKIMQKSDLIKIGLREDDGIEFKKEWFDTSSIQKEFGFKPLMSFEDSIRISLKRI
jgi:nucleoside-diphosphate-sugar epimerase